MLLPPDPEIVQKFHHQYYHRNAVIRWFGWPMMKCPLDLWIYQEILSEVLPDVIVECGTAWGGSAMYFACLMDLIGNGQIITIDVKHEQKMPNHGRISYLKGSSTDPDIVQQVKDLIGDAKTVMVILDSDHSYEHVKAELAAYADLVTPGSYLIVEDTNLGHEVRKDYGRGPREAVADWIVGRKDYAIDRSRERFMLTYNPQGYLKRVS
jgi:cephalosporin hydroxylase